jgi:hypothetical protein
MTNTNSAELELIYSIRACDPAKEHIQPPPHGYAGRRNVWNSIRRDVGGLATVSDVEMMKHGYTLFLPNKYNLVDRMPPTL